MTRSYLFLSRSAFSPSRPSALLPLILRRTQPRCGHTTKVCVCVRSSANLNLLTCCGSDRPLGPRSAEYQHSRCKADRNTNTHTRSIDNNNKLASCFFSTHTLLVWSRIPCVTQVAPSAHTRCQRCSSEMKVGPVIFGDVIGGVTKSMN